MKVAVTAERGELTSRIDPRFGRARWFLVVDTETGSVDAHDNSRIAALEAGAGTRAAQAVIDLGATAVITGNMGPKALEVLQAGGVDVYAGVTGTAQDALRAFQAGRLDSILRPNVQSHWAAPTA